MGIREGGRPSDGFWMLRTGECLGGYLDETGEPDDFPFLALTSVLSHYMASATKWLASGDPGDIADFCATSKWIEENPFPDDASPPTDWLRKLARVLILHRVTLVWRGAVTTGLTETEDIKAMFRGAKEKIIRLGWPEGTLVPVRSISREGPPIVRSVTVANSEFRFAEDENLSAPQLTSSPNSEGPDAVGANLESRLKLLKSLFDQGLISQEEHASKRAELLTQI